MESKVEKIDEKMSFRPCPICGAKLTAEDFQAEDWVQLHIVRNEEEEEG